MAQQQKASLGAKTKKTVLQVSIASSGLLILAALLFYTSQSSSTLSYKGPAGIGSSSSNNIWIDVSRMDLEDSTELNSLSDQSGNANPNSASSGQRPLYRSDSAFLVNGRPIIFFDGEDDFIKYNSSNNINTDGPYEEKFISIAFQTRNDVASRQWIYEQGGNVRGINFYIENGDLYMGAYNLANDDETTPWPYIYVQIPIQANQTYVASFSFDYPNDRIIGYLNGVAQDTVRGIGRLHSHPNEIGLGGMNSQSYDPNGQVNSGVFPFKGNLLEFISYEYALNQAQTRIFHDYLNAKFGLATELYDHESTHSYQVAGLGMEADGSMHEDARGPALVRIQNPDDLGPEEFLIWGHNGADITQVNTSEVDPSSVDARLERTWKFTHVGDLGRVDFILNVEELPGSNPQDYYLLIERSGDNFRTQDVTPSMGTYDAGDQTLTFTGINFQDGDLVGVGLSSSNFPVEWLYVDGEAQGGKIALSWGTAIEVNNDYFTVEKMGDDQAFQAMGRVEGFGNTSSPKEYSYTDPEPRVGSNVYRIKQTDIDGKFSYSQMIEVRMEEKGERRLNLYPNPLSAGESLKLELSRGWEGEIRISIRDIQGRKVKEEIKDLHGGFNTVGLSTAALRPGPYVITLDTPEGQLSKRFIIK